jgi:hypothetical protein
MRKIYIAGPYSNGDKRMNVLNAIDCAEELVRRGFVPYIPHLSHFWDIIVSHPYEFWLKYDLEWLNMCDALLRMPGESGGADKEVKFAKEHNIPVYYSVEEMK